MTRRAIVLLALLALAVAYVGWSRLMITSVADPKSMRSGQPDLLAHGTPSIPFAPPGPGQATVAVSGHWYRAFEVSYFTPCGTSNRYWVWATPESRLAERAREFPYVDSGTPALFLRGSLYLSQPGRYGHLGLYERQAVFTGVDELRPARAGDCR